MQSVIAAPGGWKVYHWLLIPVLLGVAVVSAFSWIAVVVAACGFSDCRPDVWRTPGPYFSLVIGLGAAVVSGSLLAFVPWARFRTRLIAGAVIAAAWVVYLAWLAMAIT